MAKLSTKSSNGTSYHCIDICSTVNELTTLLGEPEVGMDDKVQYQWVCETEEGDVFTIYDWKERFRFRKDTPIRFHIGAHSERVCKIAKDELKQMML